MHMKISKLTVYCEGLLEYKVQLFTGTTGVNQVVLVYKQTHGACSLYVYLYVYQTRIICSVLTIERTLNNTDTDSTHVFDI